MVLTLFSFPLFLEWLSTAFAASGFAIALKIFLSGIGLGVAEKVILFYIT
jgi:hypothetical protein